jgi:hypothetical protein
MLSHPLGISGLVGRYPANYLVPRKPLSRRNLTICSPDNQVRRGHPVLPGVSPGYPGPGGTSPTPYYPVSRSSGPRRDLVARLACLIHAANVHSEPGSNPSEKKPSSGSPRVRREVGAGPPARNRFMEFDLQRYHLPVASDGRWPLPATSANSKIKSEFTNQIAKDRTERTAGRNRKRSRPKR